MTSLEVEREIYPPGTAILNIPKLIYKFIILLLGSARIHVHDI